MLVSKNQMHRIEIIFNNIREACKKYKIVFLFFIVFSVNLGRSQSLNIVGNPSNETVSGKVITKETSDIFFKTILLGDKYKKPFLESFDSGQKSVGLKKAINQFKKRIKEDHKKSLKGLKAILLDFKISDKKTLERILLDLYRETPIEERGKIYNNWLSKDDIKKEIANSFFIEFLNVIEDRYEISDPNSKKRQSINLFYKIIDSETIGRKEVRLFRKILSKMGLPSHAHHDELIKLYLIEFKEKQLQKTEGDQRLKIRDQDVLKVLKETTIYFDDIHFSDLTETTRFVNIAKGFSAQYILFQAAIGAMIYRENITDPLLYGAHTKPGYLEDFMKQSLTPSSVISFFLFIVVSQKMNHLLYKGGRHFNKNFLKSMAPHVGLASGFFVSTLATELYQDADFRECVGSIQLSKREEGDENPMDKQHLSSCEKSYIKWIQSKWSSYAVDIAALLGASWVSHKIVQAVLMGIRMTALGESLSLRLAVGLGTRLSGWAGFFITIYSFMEVHQVLEKHMGKPVKNYLKVVDITGDMFALNHLQSEEQMQSEEQRLDSPSEELKQSEEPMQSEEQRLDSPSEELKQSEEQMQSEEQRLDSPSEELNEKITTKIKLVGRRFNDWLSLKGQDYQWSFSLWLQKTNKITLFYQQSRELLEYLYNQSQGSYDFIIDTMSSEHLPQDKGFLIDKKVFNENREHYGELLCADDLIQTAPNIQIWKRFCEDPKNIGLTKEDLILLAYETTFIIFDHFNYSESNFNVLNYLGKHPEELFSLDPKYSVETLSVEDQVRFVQSLLEAVYGAKDSVISQILSDNDFENTCLEETSSEQDYDLCISYSYYSLRDKMLAAAVYVLKKHIFQTSNLDGSLVLGSGYFQSLEQKNFQQVLGNRNIQKIEDLLRLLNIYKKGEILFSFQFRNYEFLKQEVGLNRIGSEDEIEQIKNYPHLFFQNIVCGLEEDSQNDYFIAPHLFKDLAYVCENINLEVGKSKWFYASLFSKPIETNGKKYSNLWLFLEDYIRLNFKSAEDLLEFFEEKSENRIKQLSSENLEALDHLNENYLLSSMINFSSKVKNLKSCEEIVDYYSESNLLSINLKGLEKSLFQIIYWMNRLEVRYSKLSSKCEIIEFLKEYHDSYAQDAGPYIFIPSKDEMNNLKTEIVTKDFSLLIKEFYPDVKIPILVSPEIILSVILKEGSYFQKDNPVLASIFMNAAMIKIQRNAKVFSGKDEIEYALLFELKLSLDSFFQRLNLLQMKEDMEKRLKP